MSALSGILTTVNAQSDVYVGDWEKGVFVKHARGSYQGAPLFVLSSMLGNEKKGGDTFNWFERAPMRRTVYSSATATSAATTLSFDDGSTTNDIYPYLQAGVQLVNERTQEHVIVATTPTANAAVVVSRGYAGTTAAAIADNDVWTIIGLARNQSDTDAAAAVYESLTTVSNYIQIFSSTVSMSKIYKASITRESAEGELNQLRSQALEQVCNDIEFSLFFGRKAAGARKTTGGIVDAVANSGLSELVLNGNGTAGAQLNDLNAWLEASLTQGSGQKVIFCGPKAFSAISNFANTNAGGYRTNPADTVFGMSVTTVQTPYGSCDLVAHPQFKVATGKNDWAVIADLQNLKLAYMAELQLQQNIQTDASLTYQEQFLAAYGLVLKDAGAFGYAYGLQKIINT